MKKGKVLSIVFDPVYKLRIESDNGETGEYPFDSAVKVTRNGKTAGVRDILAGDTISVTTNYGIIKSAVATSQQSTVTGVIKEVIISKSPRITLTKDGVDTTYFVDANAKIVAQVCKVHVEIPTDRADVIKDSKTCDTTDKSEGAINCVINQLRCSVFKHNFFSFLFF